MHGQKFHYPMARVVALTSLLLCSLAPTAAQAGEGIFGFLYTLDLQPKRTWEVEQRVDVTHRQQVGVYDLGQYRTELEYGVTDDLQLGAYINAFSVHASKNYTNPEMCDPVATPCTAGFGVPSRAHGNSSYNRLLLDGGSVEAIWRVTNPVTSPVGVGFYLEPTWGRLESSIEFRVLLQSNFLDDRLILAANLVYEPEQEKYDNAGIIRNSMGDILYGASYRFAPRWTGGVEGRFHTDHDGYYWNERTQIANFLGPTLHYASQKWWTTVAWRHQLNGRCFADGTADCADGYNKVSDNHGRDQFVLKVGYLFD